jgi:hypothetical protein
MLFVVACMLVTSALVVGLLGVLFGELLPTSYERKSERTIAASQAGLQAGLAAIKQAWSTTTGSTHNGNPSRLPCYGSGNPPLTGDVAGLDTGQDPVHYKVQILYYTENPAGQSDPWRTANALPCNGTGLASTPVYALVQALGYADVAAVPSGWGDRATEVVYMLDRNDRAQGGPIHSDLVSSDTKNLCWQASSYPPAVGTTIELNTCTPGVPAQTWLYRPDYKIVLVGTDFCIDGQPNADKLRLKHCTNDNNDLWKQLWVYGASGEFQAVTSQKQISSNCLTTDDVYAVGAQLTIGPCDPAKDNWTLDPSAGTGAAGARRQQLTNYSEVGRCLDITNWDVQAAWLIDYPCEQDPDPTQPAAWHQQWIWDQGASRQIQSNTPSGLYCLTTAGLNAYVVVRPCDTTRADQKWTVLGDTGAWSTSYTVVDANGRCLSLGPPGNDPSLSFWSSITAAGCDGSDKQKWNAQPPPALLAQRETTGGR